MDDFSTDANGAPNSSNWVTQYGSFVVSSGVLTISTVDSTGMALMYNKDDGVVTAYGTQCSGFIIGTMPNTYTNLGAAIRIQTSSKGFYGLYYGNGTIFLNRLTGNNYIRLATTTSYTVSSGDYLEVCGQGSSLTVNYNNAAGTVAGEIMSATDTTYPTGYPGIVAYSDGTPGGTFSFWTGESNGTWRFTVGVSGDTICGSGGCPQGATHTPIITNTNGTLGVTNQYGTPVPPATYMDDYWTTDYPFDYSLLPITGVTGMGEVYCSFVGPFFGSGSSQYIAELAITYETAGKANGNGQYDVTADCTPPTNDPPDFNPALIFGRGSSYPVSSPYYKMVGYCNALGFANHEAGTWECQQIAYKPYTSAETKVEFNNFGNGSAYNCTNYNHNYSGRPYP